MSRRSFQESYVLKRRWKPLPFCIVFPRNATSQDYSFDRLAALLPLNSWTVVVAMCLVRHFIHCIPEHRPATSLEPILITGASVAHDQTHSYANPLSLALCKHSISNKFQSQSCQLWLLIASFLFLGSSVLRQFSPCHVSSPLDLIWEQIASTLSLPSPRFLFGLNPDD